MNNLTVNNLFLECSGSFRSLLVTGLLHNEAVRAAWNGSILTAKSRSYSAIWQLPSKPMWGFWVGHAELLLYRRVSFRFCKRGKCPFQRYTHGVVRVIGSRGRRMTGPIPSTASSAASRKFSSSSSSSIISRVALARLRRTSVSTLGKPGRRFPTGDVNDPRWRFSLEIIGLDGVASEPRVSRAYLSFLFSFFSLCCPLLAGIDRWVNRR